MPRSARDVPAGAASEVEAAIAGRKQALDRQTVMAIVGMAAVAGFLVIYPNDTARTIEGLKVIAPWFLGLSVLMFAANRWTLSLQAKAIRQSQSSSSAQQKS